MSVLRHKHGDVAVTSVTPLRPVLPAFDCPLPLISPPIRVTLLSVASAVLFSLTRTSEDVAYLETRISSFSQFFFPFLWCPGQSLDGWTDGVKNSWPALCGNHPQF